MRTPVALLVLASLSFPVVAQTPAAQTPVPAMPVVGDRSSALRPVAGAGNVGISNAVLRDQEDVRALRVVVEPGGTRAMHAHNDVKYHLFVPVSGSLK